MKLAKKLGALTLASAMAVTAVPSVAMANDNTVVVAPQDQVAPMPEKDQEEIEAQKEKLTKAISDAEVKLAQKNNYTAYSYNELQKAVKEAKVLLDTKYNDVTNDFTYTTDSEYTTDENYATQYKADVEKVLTKLAEVSTVDDLETKDEVEGTLVDISEVKVKLTELKNKKFDDGAKVLADDLNSTYGLTPDAEGYVTVEELQEKLEIEYNNLSIDPIITTTTTQVDVANIVADIEVALEQRNKDAEITEAIKVAKAILKDTNSAKTYTKASLVALEEAIEAAEAETAGGAELTRLQDATKVAGKGQATGLVDITPVNKAIDQAEAFVKTTNNKETNKYSASSFKLLTDAIVAEKENLEDALKEADVKYGYGTAETTPETAAKALLDMMKEKNGEAKNDAVAKLVKTEELVALPALIEAYEKEHNLDKKENFTTSTYNQYIAAKQGVNSLIYKVADPTDTTITYEVLYGATGVVVKAYNDILGMERNNDGSWKESETLGLADKTELVALIEEDLKADDYVNNAEWDTYTSSVTLTDTAIDALTKDGVADRVKAIKEAKAKLIPLSNKGIATLLAKAERYLEHKDAYDTTGTEFEDLKDAYDAAKKATSANLSDKIKVLNDKIVAVEGLPYKNPDLQALKNELNRVKTAIRTKILSDIYMNDSAEALQSAMDAAQQLLDAYADDEDELQAATAKLTGVTANNDNTTGQENGYIFKNTKGILVAITNARTVLDTITNEAARTKLQAAIDAAYEVYGDGTQSVAAAKCQEVYDSLQNAVTVGEITVAKLNELIASVEGNRYGYDIEDDAWKTTVLPVIEAAQKVAANSKATAVEIIQAYKNLEKAVKDLDAVNKTTLAKLVEDYTKQYVETNYSVDTWAAYKEALEQANKALEGSAEVSKEIYDAQKELEKAAGELVKVDEDVEEELNDLAQYVLPDAKAEKYPAEAWAKYVVVRDEVVKELYTATKDADGKLTGVETVLATDSVVAKYKNARESLRKIENKLFEAHQALKESKVTSATLAELVEKAQAKVESDYTAETWKTFKAALENAEKMVDEGTPSQIVKAYDELEKAMKELKATGSLGFVNTLYDRLGREGDAEGLKAWTEAINNGAAVAEVVSSFITTGEFNAKYESTEDYIGAVYEIAFGREPESTEALEFWTNLAMKHGREYIVSEMLAAGEFGNVTGEFGLEPGKATVEITPEKFGKILEFTKRLYTKGLGRAEDKVEADVVGIDAWTQPIADGRLSGVDVAKAILTSKEFTDKNLSNEDFVKVLYNVYFDREGDAEGIAAWVAALEAGETREAVMAGFGTTPEYAKVCAAYGIK